MPGMNGKGPMGTRPVGKGFGPCQTDTAGRMTEEEQRQQPAELNRAQGLRRGNRCGCGAGRGAGGGRGGGRGQRGGNR